MKIKEIITEEQVSPYTKEKLDPDVIMEKLFTDCSEAVSSGFLDFPIWRGFKSLGVKFAKLDPSQGERKSQNTSNHYTMLMDNSPYMKGWPKRGRSFICSSGYSYPSSFGSVYMMIPFDGVKIAVCPYRDLWATPLSFPEFNRKYGKPDYYTGDWSDFNYWLEARLGIKSTSFKDMIAYTKTYGFREILEYNVAPASLPVQPENFIPYLQQRLSPKNTGLKLMSIPQYAAKKPDDREVWFSGPCYAISRDIVQNIARHLLPGYSPQSNYY